MAGEDSLIEIISSGEPQQVEFGNSALPDALPVLPLRETVTYPDTLTPLAIGQERSVELVNDVLAGNRMIAMVASKDPENENPGPDQLYEVGVAGTIARMMKMPDGTLRVLVQGTQRIKLIDYVSTTPYLVARVEELPDEIEESTELEALVRSVQALVQPDRRERSLPAGRADDRRRQRRRPERAGPRDRRLAAAEDRGEAGAARGGQRLQAPAPTGEVPRPRGRRDRSRHEDPEPGPGRGRQEPARVLPAPAAEGDPGRARRERSRRGRGRRAARADSTKPTCPRTSARRPSASSSGSSGCPPRPPSTA